MATIAFCSIACLAFCQRGSNSRTTCGSSNRNGNSTDWGHRPLGVQNLTLAYTSGAAWNETGFANEEFDSLLADAWAIADAAGRSEVMAQIQQIMIDEGVVIQPFWRSIYRHYTDNVVGAETHPIFEIHVHKLGFAA